MTNQDRKHVVQGVVIGLALSPVCSIILYTMDWHERIAFVLFIFCAVGAIYAAYFVPDE